MVNKIVIKVEQWEDNKLISQHSSAFDSTDKKLSEIAQLSKNTLINNLSEVITDCLVR